jgi:hypothetical protein
MCFTAISCEVRLCACFTLNFVLIYIVLAHVLLCNHSSQNPCTIGCTRFSRRNFGPHLLLQNRYRIYAKFRTHLRCFSSRFTLESARARTSTRSGVRGYTSLGLPILMEAQGFHYLLPIYIYIYIYIYKHSSGTTKISCTALV